MFRPYNSAVDNLYCPVSKSNLKSITGYSAELIPQSSMIGPTRFVIWFPSLSIAISVVPPRSTVTVRELVGVVSCSSVSIPYPSGNPGFGICFGVNPLTVIEPDWGRGSPILKSSINQPGMVEF